MAILEAMSRQEIGWRNGGGRTGSCAYRSRSTVVIGTYLVSACMQLTGGRFSFLFLCCQYKAMVAIASAVMTIAQSVDLTAAMASSTAIKVIASRVMTPKRTSRYPSIAAARKTMAIAAITIAIDTET